MNLSKKQCEARKRSAKARHDQVVKDYYENPKLCLACGNIIPLILKRAAPVAEARRKKFCNRSCAITYNNSKFPKRFPFQTEGLCEECGCRIVFLKNGKGNYKRKRFCDECRELRRKRPKTFPKPLEEMSIEELTILSGRLQARTHITRHARRFYIDTGLPQSCKICGFDFCFDVAHIKPVASFGLHALIKEINEKSNLVALCPNHHRMYDAGVISL